MLVGRARHVVRKRADIRRRWRTTSFWRYTRHGVVFAMQQRTSLIDPARHASAPKRSRGDIRGDSFNAIRQLGAVTRSLGGCRTMSPRWLLS